MQKAEKNRLNRVRNLIVLCAISAVILSVSTYAWFIGMQRVGVNPFEISIEVTDSLLLSLDGDTFHEKVTINSENLDEVSYENHTNSWGLADSEGNFIGLKPVSTVGEMDSDVSRMILFEKSSMTASPGGFRLLSSRINNFQDEDDDKGFTGAAKGYVVFDLFIKNFTGDEYYTTNDVKNEEAIYLTKDSEVTVGSTGIENTGIENAIRVAFAQIGRVKADTTASTVTGITCNVVGESEEPQYTEETGITGICRKAQIWEPNDTKHNENAIKWYQTSCLSRIGETVMDSQSFEDDSCGEVKEGEFYDTYAIAAEITPNDEVDVYDGPHYNGYEGSGEFLQAYPYFTDTMKNKSGTERPEFMSLAPNSITKVRVYIYLEGQDIDNYEFSMIGKQVSVKFGFEKQRYEPSDIEYEGQKLPYDEEGEGGDEGEDD
jgi:hypothetical protein